jgi:hypothetical protein
MALLGPAGRWGLLRALGAAVGSPAGAAAALAVLLALNARPGEVAGQAGAGYRLGERRFTLRAMLEQDAAATLRWAVGQDRWWRRSHARRCGADPACRWWAGRAAGTVRMLRFAVAEVTGRLAGWTAG